MTVGTDAGRVGEFDISVILAEAPGRPDPEPALASIARACVGLRAEILVVRPRGRAPLGATGALTIRELATDETTLIPERWGAGVRAATAPVFACLTTEFTVREAWARDLLAALAAGAVGAAGAIELDTRAGATAAAVYLVRFSPYLPRRGEKGVVVSNIPGDTAAYRRDAVAAFPDLLAEGFWEIEFHRRFIAAGQQLVALPWALSTYQSNRSLGASLLLRYRHGHEYGVTRVRKHHHNVWRLILGSPLVPVVLVARIVGRVSAVPGHRGLALRAAPGLCMISVAWAAGEAAGAWSARRRR